ncbi:FAD-dependent oxidoreductase [Niveispirillum fermenti]|uniref:FAD-dependent oxidoreductase n=1 Tax=Niveispirillum fermenti TaxID=1233113 RepID=UPI003A84C322
MNGTASQGHIPVWHHIGASPPPVAGVDDAGNSAVPVVIVGAGPVGLAMALDLGRRGHRVVVLNRLDFIPAGSKAICFSKRSLDIFDRLGVGDAITEKGVVWNVGKVFRGAETEPVFQFDMLPVKGQKRPGFVNIQQYHVEEYLWRAVAGLSNVELRWGHAVTGVRPDADGVELSVDAGGDPYRLRAGWVVACDGSRSAVRSLMGLDFDGRVFEDHFLIADIAMKGDRPAERWFWFDPPFNPGQSALLHRQPDDVWRLDFQLGWNIDREKALDPANVTRLVRAMLGDDVVFEPVWTSLYTFQCRRMRRFLHGRVIFAGDSAHLVSPFGARGCNGGVADIDNLGWKLDLVLKGLAGPDLLESYDHEAVVTADENILNSSRSTDFLTPKSAVSTLFRDAVLELAGRQPFARPMVNSGRLSTPVSYPHSPLNSPDMQDWHGAGVAPGSPAVDMALEDGWLLERLGDGFVLMADGWEGPVPDDVRLLPVEAAGAAAQRYGLMPGAAYLFRPDQYVAARWHRPDAGVVAHACRKARGFKS